MFGFNTVSILCWIVLVLCLIALILRTAVFIFEIRWYIKGKRVWQDEEDKDL